MKFLFLILVFPPLALFLGTAIHHYTQRFFLSCCLNLIFWHVTISLLFSLTHLNWVLVYAVLGLYGSLFDVIIQQLDN